MVFTSPLPDVEIPEVPFTGYILENAAALGDKPALDRRPDRPHASPTRPSTRPCARWPAAWCAKASPPGDVLALMAPNIPEYAVDLPRRRDGRRHDHHDQPDLHRARGAQAARRLRRHDLS